MTPGVAQTLAVLQELAAFDGRVAALAPRLAGDPELAALQRDLAAARAWWLARLAALQTCTTVH
jgi:hypothetical protein